MISKLINLENLSIEESYSLIASFDQYTLEKQAAILALLRAKNESAEEILGFIRYFRQFSKNIEHPMDIIDIVGTGGDSKNTFNISTAASLVIASSEIYVAKHGGSSATSKTGSLQVAQVLGIRMAESPEECICDLKRHHYTYLSAPIFNTALGKHADLRKRIGHPTIFNIIGPLLNPLSPKRIVIGVYRKDLMPVITEILKIHKVKHALVVHSEDGLDEISISSTTYLTEIINNTSCEYQLHPQDLGIPIAPVSKILGGTAIHNASIIHGIFSGEIKGAKLDVVSINVAAGLYISGKVSSIVEGFQLAKQNIRQGKTLALLNKLSGRRR